MTIVRRSESQWGADFPVARHTLVWLDPDRWREHLLAPPGDLTLGGAKDELQAWIAVGRPAVVCRDDIVNGSDGMVLGVALPPRLGETPKRRVAFRIAEAAVTGTSAPLALATEGVIASAPARWQELMRMLCAEGAKIGICWRIFGSLAWQHLSGGEPYVTPSSDLDLLWEPGSVAQLDAGIALLQRADAVAAETAALPRLDGEIIFPDDQGVSWREWAHARGDSVLVKRTDGVRLQARCQLRSDLESDFRIAC